MHAHCISLHSLKGTSHNANRLSASNNTMTKSQRRESEAHRGLRAPMSSWLAILICWTTLLVTTRSSAQTTTPTSTTSACRLHYSRFHLLWTLPPLAILFLLTRPFLTRLDRHKLAILPCIALVWTTPWDNELVRQGAWWYPSSCVAARIGYVPVEEYAFFILQSWITTLFTILITRWITPTGIGSRESRLSFLVPLLPSSTMVFGLLGLKSVQGFGRMYYISMIAWWASIPLILLWFGTQKTWIGLLRGPCRPAIAWLTCIIIPTVYLCCADVFALRRGTWHIEERKSLQVFVVPNLPLEEATFFFMTNLILVSACLAFDRVVWQMRSRQVSHSVRIPSPTSPTYFHFDRSTIPAIWHAFMHLDVVQKQGDAYDNAWQKAQLFALRILEKASTSFHVASKLLPWDLRTDLGSIYAFARAMDDFIDTPPAANDDQRKDDVQERVTLLRALVKAAFDTNDRLCHAGVRSRVEACFDTFAPIATHQRTELSVSAQAASVLREIVPVHLWNELIDGYATDNQPNGPFFVRSEEQAEYAQDVAGSIGEMCVRVVLARSGVRVDREHKTERDVHHDDLTSKTLGRQAKEQDRYRQILRDARRMGVSLQYVNIARDIVDDATSLRRCYLVLSTTEKEEADLRAAIQSGRLTVDGKKVFSANAGHKEEEEEEVERSLLASSPCRSTDVSANVLFRHKLALLRTANEIYAASVDSIDAIPDIPSRTGFRVACAVYIAIGDAICRDGKDGCKRRSRLSTWERTLVALKAVYA